MLACIYSVFIYEQHMVNVLRRWINLLRNAINTIEKFALEIHPPPYLAQLQKVLKHFKRENDCRPDSISITPSIPKCTAHEVTLLKTSICSKVSTSQWQHPPASVADTKAPALAEKHSWACRQSAVSPLAEESPSGHRGTDVARGRWARGKAAPAAGRSSLISRTARHTCVIP